MRRYKNDILIDLIHYINERDNKVDYHKDDYAYEDEVNMLISQYHSCVITGMPLWIFGEYTYTSPNNIHHKFDRII